MGRWHTEVPSPGVAAFIGFADQAKPSLLGLGVPGRPLFTHPLTPFGFNLDEAVTRAQGIGIGAAEVC